ncbi:YfiT family bacillithiol transferase [Spirosoma sp.]|uniref:YfiT family bacillithiol transferase n=1 Tax=Spirosoma sp. TaxID=1899569 RepID=UPI003B3A2110
MDNRKFPIGPLKLQDSYSADERSELIRIIEASPSQYRQLVEHLSPEELTRTYREGSWTVRQLVHHVSDMQFLHYMRMKKALTEPDYKIVTLVNMDGWANTPDATEAPIEDSLRMFEGVHQRYAYLAKTLTEPMLAITYYHPVRQIYINQAQALAMSAWHVQHHLAHIRLALQ